MKPMAGLDVILAFLEWSDVRNFYISEFCMPVGYGSFVDVIHFIDALSWL